MKFESARLCKLKKVIIIPVVIGALGMATNRMGTWIKKVGINCIMELLQKRKPLKTDKNNPECVEHLESEEKCTISKAAGFDPLSM